MAAVPGLLGVVLSGWPDVKMQRDVDRADDDGSGDSTTGRHDFLYGDEETCGKTGVARSK
ncbi:hypothetical protein O9K51_05253 [Purpureocillium lavendulum]|uniref:Uncharacterized protein n=1 Tax=Purpureocillium lavendulum TaxID=1247861 RepID=A0AB34FQZ9_9HYPO|nr:hypothetical protein O9K51_05253 [Purpureocillium lavendulum]